MNSARYRTGSDAAPPSAAEYYGGRCTDVTAKVGVDEATNLDPTGGAASCEILGDGNEGPLGRLSAQRMGPPPGWAQRLQRPGRLGGSAHPVRTMRGGEPTR